MKTVTAILSITFVILLAAFGNAIIASASDPVTATESQATEICFPQGSWNARDEDRPCDLLFRPYEDGSSQLILGTIGSDAATCVIPNVYEERGKFVIHCHRVRNR